MPRLCDALPYALVLLLLPAAANAQATLAGVVLGLGLSYVLDRYRLVRIPTDVYQIASAGSSRAACRDG